VPWTLVADFAGCAMWVLNLFYILFYNLLESRVWDSLRICKSDQSLAQHDKELVIIYVIQFAVLHEVDSHQPHDLKTHDMCHVTLKISQFLDSFLLYPLLHIVVMSTSEGGSSIIP
jgi:hypothetical protein